MIHQWEMLHYPSERDPDRYRLSLWSDGIDVAKLRNLFPGRAGAIWIPRRKPYNCAFFLYGISKDEKDEIEEILSGKMPFPDAPAPALPVQSVDENLTKEDTQEVILVESSMGAGTSLRIGLGESVPTHRTLRLGYFVPDYLPNAAEVVHGILTRTLSGQKISVHFEKIFSFSYATLSLGDIHRLLKQCQEQLVTRIIAVGEPVHLIPLQKIGKKSGIFVKPIAESVLDKNLWLSLIAEIIAYE